VEVSQAAPQATIPNDVVQFRLSEYGSRHRYFAAGPGVRQPRAGDSGMRAGSVSCLGVASGVRVYAARLVEEGVALAQRCGLGVPYWPDDSQSHYLGPGERV
jgi:hypothetical protein